MVARGGHSVGSAERNGKLLSTFPSAPLILAYRAPQLTKSTKFNSSCLQPCGPRSSKDMEDAIQRFSLHWTGEDTYKTSSGAVLAGDKHSRAV